MVFRKRQQLSSGGGMLRAVSVLVSGTAAGYAVTALAMPVLSRLYTPADFGLLAVFTGIVTTIGVAASLRYDVAVALPESNDEAIALLVLSLLVALLVSLLALVIVGWSFEPFTRWIAQPGIDQARWLIPLGIFLAAAWSALQNWHLRGHRFGLLAKARIGQAAVCVATQAGGALTGFGSVALLAGLPAGYLASGVIYLASAWKDLADWLGRGPHARLVTVAREYRRFPAYSTWEALFNQAAIHLPILLIAGATTTAEAGYLMLGVYVLQIPMSLLGSAIGQAYLSRAPSAFREGHLLGFTNDVLANLVKGGAGPILAVGIVAPVAMPLVFGAPWERAGWLVTWMTPWFLLQFLASPVSMALHVVGAQRAAMSLQLFALITRLGMTWLAIQLANERVAEAYALSGAVTYLGYLALIKRYLRRTSHEESRLSFRPCLVWIAPWLIGGSLLAILINRIDSLYAS